jgi:hypothetical protein
MTTRSHSRFELVHDVLRHARRNPLDAIFSPKNVAVIGATEKPGSVGCALSKNVLRSWRRSSIEARASAQLCTHFESARCRRRSISLSLSLSRRQLKVVPQCVEAMLLAYYHSAGQKGQPAMVGLGDS